ncbi:MAG: hypothetical protein UT24_C0029G0030 [Candidatus Woesebacteria bacterium GW2011_GWB1_39_12]|uniref:Siphovirus-type tail component RIFT-related domain-containing protein n=1 Tax=Candidatus Woesebacteria bacterium GW2011_GWB1_39_12 TaxID=1618574 RepID=A0A0G0M4A1_9BACT|nr:MAG: hypothetical protein UT24_C0029G0030 [Candidatus Woesebacteria bacterium GW2011_GWB1_39_12]
MAITFDAFSLQDSNYIITDTEYRTIPSREITLESIARKPGKKFLAEEFGERRIRLSGFIEGSSASDLITKIDDLHTNVTRKKIGTLSIDADRDIQTLVVLVAIAEPHYSQTIVPMSLEFVAAEPFYQGAQRVAVTAIAEGTASATITTTISGSVFTEPIITYTPKGGGSNTNIYRIDISYDQTGEEVTWSGGNHPLSNADSVAFDYSNQIITEGNSEIEASGVFARFEPGSTNLTVTYYSTSTSSTTTSTSSTTRSTSTTHTGTTTSTTRSTSTSTTTTLASPTITITYRPRYL